MFSRRVLEFYPEFRDGPANGWWWGLSLLSLGNRLLSISCISGANPKGRIVGMGEGWAKQIVSVWLRVWWPGLKAKVAGGVAKESTERDEVCAFPLNSHGSIVFFFLFTFVRLSTC